MRKAGIALLLGAIVWLTGAVGASAQSSNLRIAVLDLDVVMTESLAAKQANANLAAFVQERQNEINEINARVDALQNELASDNLSNADRTAKQQELNALIDELQRRVVQAQEEINARQQQLRNAVLNDIGQVLRIIGQERDYSLILDSSAVFYYKLVVDITWEVVRRYDELFEAAVQSAATQATAAAGQ